MLFTCESVLKHPRIAYSQDNKDPPNFHNQSGGTLHMQHSASISASTTVLLNSMSYFFALTKGPTPSENSQNVSELGVFLIGNISAPSSIKETMHDAGCLRQSSLIFTMNPKSALDLAAYPLSQCMRTLSEFTANVENNSLCKETQGDIETKVIPEPDPGTRIQKPLILT